jgi:alpha-galactosidase
MGARPCRISGEVTRIGRLTRIGRREYWKGRSEAGTLVLILNTLDQGDMREVCWSELNLEPNSCAYQVTDMWSWNDLGCVKGGLTTYLESHDTAAFLVGDSFKPSSGGCR